MVLEAQIPTQGINYDNKIWTLNVMIGEERLCAEVTYKRMGTVSIGGKQCKIHISKVNEYWCLTVTLDNHLDQGNKKYEI